MERNALIRRKSSKVQSHTFIPLSEENAELRNSYDHEEYQHRIEMNHSIVNNTEGITEALLATKPLQSV